MGTTRRNVGGLSRRDVLRAALLNALLAQLGGCASTPEPEPESPPGPDVGPAPPEAPFAWVPIDVHCHVFNGLDVPVQGFLERVTLAADDAISEKAAKSVAWLVDRMVQKSAKTIADERKVLEDLLASGASAADRGDPSDADLQRKVDDALKGAPGLEKDLESASGNGPDLPEWLLHGAARRYVEWAWILTGFRHEACGQLVRAYGGGEDGIQLFTPALVDLDFWLGGDTALTTMDEQTEILALISRLHGGRVHGFVGFNPWRAATDPTTPNEAHRWVMNAVRKRGFLGVKLYPPMGYAPTWNGRLPAVPGQPAGLGKQIDRVLAELFAWCEREQVPIMAHCEDSNESGPDLGKRADPRRWEPVLRRHPKLRLNLAHFGGLKALATDVRRSSWGWSVAELMDRYEHVYADVGHFDEIADANQLDSWLDGLEGLRERHPSVARRIMYGSDWHLLAKERVGEDYYGRFRDAYGKRFGEEDLGRFLGGNAASFLDVRTGGKNRARLAAFYAEHTIKPPAWFDALA